MNGFDLVAAKVNKVVFMDMMYNFGCAAGNIGPSKECYDSAQAAVKMPPNVRHARKHAQPTAVTSQQQQQQQMQMYLCLLASPRLPTCCEYADVRIADDVMCRRSA